MTRAPCIAPACDTCLAAGGVDDPAAGDRDPRAARDEVHGRHGFGAGGMILRYLHALLLDPCPCRAGVVAQPTLEIPTIQVPVGSAGVMDGVVVERPATPEGGRARAGLPDSRRHRVGETKLAQCLTGRRRERLADLK